MRNGAVISDDGRYRYRLDRLVTPDDGERKVIAYIGVNPSTADAATDDATVRKLREFTLRNAGWRFIVANAFGYRATDVRELAHVADPVGAENDNYLRTIIREADLIVPCWGSRGKLPQQLRGRLDDVEGYFRQVDATIQIFGLTNSFDPMHPLMLGYNTPLVPWYGGIFN
jgi:hypothetical protein